MEQNFFDIDPRLEKLGEQAQLDCAQAFARTEEIGEYNSRKVLAAFLHNGVSESHFAGKRTANATTTFLTQQQGIRRTAACAA